VDERLRDHEPELKDGRLSDRSLSDCVTLLSERGGSRSSCTQILERSVGVPSEQEASKVKPNSAASNELKRNDDSMLLNEVSQ
jgi:hypothetical protein